MNVCVGETSFERAEDVTRRFQSLNQIECHIKLKDGFRMETEKDHETLLVDAIRDVNLQNLITSMTSFSTIYAKQPMIRKATAIAKFVVHQFNDVAPTASDTKSNPNFLTKKCAHQYYEYLTQLRLQNQANANGMIPTVEIKIGDLFKKGRLDRHLAILFKRLADTDGINIPCRLIRRWLSCNDIRVDVVISIDKKDHYVDFGSVPPRLLNEDTTEGKVFWSTISEPAFCPLVRLSSVRELVPIKPDISPTEFLSQWGNSATKRVFARISHRSIHHYNIGKFLTEMEALSYSQHSSMIRVRAFYVASVPPKINPSLLPNPESSTATETFTLHDRIISGPALVMVREAFEGQPLINVISNDRRKWTFQRICNAGEQLAGSIAELHRFGMIFCDLSPHTVVITPSGDIRVADWSFDRYATTAPFSIPPLRYCAPEHYDTVVINSISSSTETTTTRTVELNNNHTDDHQALSHGESFGSVKGDVFSCGAILYAIAVGSQPWSNVSNIDDVKAKVLQGELPNIPTDVNAELANLIRQCLQKDPDKRPTMNEIVTLLHTLHQKSDDNCTKEEGGLLGRNIPVFLVCMDGWIHLFPFLVFYFLVFR